MGYASKGYSYQLDACFERALARSEQLALADEALTQARERRGQAKAAYWPTLSLQATHLKQEPIDSPLARNIAPDEQTTARAKLSQNLFRGFRDRATQTQRSHEEASAEAARQGSIEQLYLDVARAFYDVLTYRSQISDLEREREVLKRRRDELAGLKRLGRARDNDLLSVEVSTASLDAEKALTSGRLRIAEDQLQFLSGVEGPLEDAEALPAALPPLSKWLAQVQLRPELKQAQESLLASDAGLRAVQSEYWPTIDLDGNYYAQRPGIYQDSNWDILLSVNLPLFNGGLTKRRFNEVASQQRSRALDLQRLTRQATLDIGAAHRLVEAEFDQLKKLQRAQDLAHDNYEAMRADNRLGLVTNLELLQVLANYYSLRRGTSQVLYNVKYDLRRLNVIAAQTNLATLASRKQADR